jgi:hypothetical protein
MSITKGKLRRSAVVVAFSLGAFQALSIIGANVASAASTCSFAGGVVTASAPADGDTLTVYEDLNGGIHVAGDVGGTQASTDGTADLAGCTGVQFGVATTTTINVTGGTGSSAFDQSVLIELNKLDTSAGSPFTFSTAPVVPANWGTINWTVNLGNNTSAGDSLNVVFDEETSGDQGVMDLTAGANGIDLNSDGDLDVTVANVENFNFESIQDGDGQNIDLSGSTITGGPFASDATVENDSFGDDNTLLGGSGDDTILDDLNGTDDFISPGLGNDNVTCSPDGTGTLDYSNTATAINMNLTINTVTQGTDLDTVTGCDNGVGTAQADTMIGQDGTDNWFTPGDGNDTVNGGGDGTDEDTYDVSDASAGVTVDLAAGTSTGGSGTDTLSNIEDVNGTDSADGITGDANDNELFGNGGNDTLSGGAGDGLDGDDSFDGGSGIDTVDYGANTLNTTVDLNSGGCQGDLADECDFIEPNTIENAILGSGDDVFTGSAFNNIVFPNGGQNALTGDGGIDTVNYSTGYTAGVTINLTNGGGTGGASDSITGFANAVGTAFNDNMTGTDVIAGGGTGANLLVGGKGNDSISANAGPDLVRGGAGNDVVRGGAGDDTLKGQGGKDNIRGSGGADDIFGGKGKDYCNGGGGNDLIKTCEKPKHHGQGPNGPGLHQRA